MKFNQRKPGFPPATAVRVFAVVALAGAVMAGPAHAQQAEMTLPTIAGYGGVPGGCGQWIAAPENSTLDLSALSWGLWLPLGDQFRGARDTGSPNAR
jgi:hypothetical protein